MLCVSIVVAAIIVAVSIEGLAREIRSFMDFIRRGGR